MKTSLDHKIVFWQLGYPALHFQRVYLYERNCHPHFCGNKSLETLLHIYIWCSRWRQLWSCFLIRLFLFFALDPSSVTSTLYPALSEATEGWWKPRLGEGCGRIGALEAACGIFAYHQRKWEGFFFIPPPFPFSPNQHHKVHSSSWCQRKTEREKRCTAISLTIFK